MTRGAQRSRLGACPKPVHPCHLPPAAVVVRSKVADFDRWLEGYDSAADLQTSKGIVGQAANRSTDDPNVAIVYHQAESFDTLRAFLADDALKAKMQDAGVTSAPEVHFVTGGRGKRYG